MSARERWTVLVAVAIAAGAIGETVRPTYVLSALTFVALNGIAALGLLVMGFAGQVSLGQAALYAIGAYISGIPTASYGWNGWAVLVVAVAADALTAFLVGLPVFRLSGLLLAMATLGFGIIVYYVLVNGGPHAPPGGRQREGPPVARRPAPSAVHDQDRLPRHLPVRAPRGRARGGRADPRLVGHDEQAHLVAYTRRDLEAWSEVKARTLMAGGVGRADIVHNAYGGLGFHYGAERVGAAVIPISGGFTERQLMALQDFGPTVLCATPSSALHLAEALDDAGIEPKSLKLRVGFFGAERLTEAIRQTLEARLNLMALNIYGLRRSSGRGCQCSAPSGGSCTWRRTTSCRERIRVHQVPRWVESC